MNKKYLLLGMIVIVSIIIFVVTLLANPTYMGSIKDTNSKEEINSNEEIQASRSISEIANPAAVYCEELGYEYNFQKGTCKPSDVIECDGWDFFSGKCSPKYTYCEKNGGKIEITYQGCKFSSECANCILPDGTKCNEWDYFKNRCP